jgi:hypothetical protein
MPWYKAGIHYAEINATQNRSKETVKNLIRIGISMGFITLRYLHTRQLAQCYIHCLPGLNCHPEGEAAPSS